MNKKLIIKISIILIIIGIGIFFAIQNYFLPAYHSYNTVCNPEEINESDYVVLGETSSSFDENTNKTIITISINENIDNKSKLYSDTIKHEMCHYNQISRGFPELSCYTPIQKYFSEVECYISEDLPNWLYDFVYKTY
ncbi:MAG: hypothetical protein ACOCV1_01540 [Bacillota bacterium]